MKQYNNAMYDYYTGEWIILKTNKPIIKRTGEGISKCRRCNEYSWDKFLYNYKNKIYCEKCLIALLRVSK